MIRAGESVYNQVAMAQQRTIDVTGLPEPLVEAIESMVRTYRDRAVEPDEHSAVSAASRPIGWLKGQWELPDSFFEPLPDDLLDLFEGKGEDLDPEGSDR